MGQRNQMQSIAKTANDPVRVGIRACFTVYRRCLVAASRALSHLTPAVARAAADSEIDPEVLFGILLLEHANRGGMTRIAERLLSRIFPGYVIRKDCSLGLCQIRISTAQRISGDPPRRVVSALLNDQRNIVICAQLLSDLQSRYRLGVLPIRDRLASTAKLYLTGRLNAPQYPWIALYAELLVDSVSSGLFRCASRHWTGGSVSR